MTGGRADAECGKRRSRLVILCPPLFDDRPKPDQAQAGCERTTEKRKHIVLCDRAIAPPARVSAMARTRERDNLTIFKERQG